MKTNKLNIIFRKLRIRAERHSPEIYLGLGLFGMATGVVLACKATHEFEPDLKEYKDKLKAIDDARKDVDETGICLTEKEEKQEIRKATWKVVKKGAKKYTVPALVLGASGYSFVRSYSKSKEQKTAILEAYTGLQGLFKAYRGSAKELIGEEAEADLMAGAKKVTGLVSSVNESGDKVEEEKEVKAVDKKDGGTINYQIWFDEFTSTQWQRDNVANECFLLSQLAYFNNKLTAEGFVILADLLVALGIDTKSRPWCYQVGWVKGSEIGDGFISFGKLEPYYMETGEHIEPTGRIMKRLSGASYLLDFNVDGYILDKI